MWSLSFRAIFSFILLQSLLSLSVYASDVPVGPKANWITEKAFNLNADVPTDDIRDGVYYLLLDWQTKIAQNNQKSAFRRYVTKAVNPKGVEDVSQINIIYDPNYQTVKLHKLVVWRDGKAIDRLNSARISELQQEKELENLIYNGDITINILLEDVRANDVVDYSYTIDGYNPIFKNALSLAHSLNWSVPIDHQYIKLLWQKSKPVSYEVKNLDVKVAQKQTPAGIEYTIEQQPVLPTSEQANAPYWFDAYATVRFTDVKDWQEVVTWGSQLFNQAYDSNAQLKAIVDKLKNQSDSPSQQIADILQFVQSEVRYLGIEFGENSHRPSNALETLERHYGDCKDKVVLLISLLNEIGVKAHPALVNTKLKYDINNRPARHTMFNHVIARVEFNDEHFWLDPTRTYQKGDLKDIHQADYGYALVLDDKSTELTEVKIRQNKSQIEINEQFDMTGPDNLSAKYQIKTRYDRGEADTIRSRLASKGLSKMQQDYLDFYQHYYPQIISESPLIFEDDQSTNTVHATESYTIENLWKANEEKKNYTAGFYANLLSPIIDPPEDISRKHPLHVDGTIDVKQTTVIHLDERDWAFDDELLELNNAFFYFKNKVTFDNKNHQLTLSYEYKTKTDVIKPSQYTEYLKAIKQVDDNLYYGVKKSMDEPQSQQDGESSETTFAQWALIGLLGYICLVILTVALHENRRRRNDTAQSSVFYPVSLLKLALFWFLTFGIYGIYWFYKNWQFVKNGEPKAQFIMPWARGLFSVFWYYPLYQAVARQAEKQQQTLGFTSLFAVLAAIIYLVASVSTYFALSFILVTLISLLLVLPLAHSINQLNEPQGDAWSYHSKWAVSSILTVILISPLTIYTYAIDLKLIPSQTVIKGDELLSFNIKYLKRKKVIKPDDKIELFYSDAFLNILDDGNGFTNRHVFSYWDDDGEFSYELANYEDIKNITVTWSETGIDNTVINIERHDQSTFLLFVDPEGAKDKLFVKQLKGFWQAKQKVTLESSNES